MMLSNLTKEAQPVAIYPLHTMRMKRRTGLRTQPSVPEGLVPAQAPHSWASHTLSSAW